ncbi:DUF485 domain-containing protein [Streptomyces daliensis]
MSFPPYEQHDPYEPHDPARPAHPDPAYPGHPARSGYVPAPPAYPPAPPYPSSPPEEPPGAGDELRRLRGAYRWLRRSMTLTALGYYVAFLCLAAFAPGVLEARIVGTSFNLGIVLGLLQIPVTLLAIVGYEHLARATVDPIARRVRVADAERRAP